LREHVLIIRSSILQLKPDNIGFSSDGIVKVFDFGLARELRPEDKDDSGLYRNMTGFTGAIRYMAPEVGANARYNLKADVYSFSMLLHHMMALEPPLGLYTPKMIVERVFVRGHRPLVDAKWPQGVNELMRVAWDESIRNRPSFSSIVDTLDRIIADIEKKAT